MKKIIFLLFAVSTVRSQNYIDYYNRANEAEYLLSQGDYGGAKKIYGELEKKFNGLKAKDDFYMGMMHYFEKDTTNARARMVKCAEDFGFPSPQLAKFKTKYPQLNISDAAIKLVEAAEAEKAKEQKKAVKDTLAGFNSLDNAYRAQGADNKKIVELQKRYLDFLKKNPEVIGLAYGDEYSMIFTGVHDPDLYKQYGKFLMKQLKKGNLYPFFYAQLVDANQSGVPVYNSFYQRGLNDEQLKIINENRKKIGMSTYFKGAGNAPITNFTAGYIKIDKQ